MNLFIQLEFLRKILGKMNDFEPKALFRRIDKLNKKTISLNDLKIFLKETSVNYSESLLNIVINFYSKNNGVLNFNE